MKGPVRFAVCMAASVLAAGAILLSSSVALAQGKDIKTTEGDGDGYGYEFGDDPLAAGGFGRTMRPPCTPGPIRRTLIRPRTLSCPRC